MDIHAINIVKYQRFCDVVFVARISKCPENLNRVDPQILLDEVYFQDEEHDEVEFVPDNSQWELYLEIKQNMRMVKLVVATHT